MRMSLAKLKMLADSLIQMQRLKVVQKTLQNSKTPSRSLFSSNTREMSSTESHQHQQQQQWSQQPHLLPPLHTQTSFPSPSTPSSSLSDQHYPSYYQPSSQNDPTIVDQRSSTSLSLNLSSLTVASPTNLSPIHPSVSPITPISPSNAGLHQNALTAHHHNLHHSHVQQPFQFSPPEQGVRYDDSQYDSSYRRITSSRSSSSSEKSVPRKRSFTSGTALSPAVEESAATPVSASYDHTDNAGTNSMAYDEVEMSYGGLDAENSPIDGSTSGGEQDEQTKPQEGQAPSAASASQSASTSAGILGKPIGTNNFVTKLYQSVFLSARGRRVLNFIFLGSTG